MRNYKKIKLIIFLFFLLYWIFGLIICRFGGYVFTESGKVRKIFGNDTGIAVPDIACWQPLFGHYQIDYHWPNGIIKSRYNVIGWLYYPFIVKMQKNFPSIQLLDSNGYAIKISPSQEHYVLHPIRGKGLETLLASE